MENIQNGAIAMEVHEVKETTTFLKTKDDEGRSMLNQYTFVRKLGEGAFGKVKLVFKGDEGKKYAVKIMKKEALKRKREILRDERGRVKYKTAFENVLKEVAIMKKVNHPNLIKLNEVIDSDDSVKMYMVMEYAEKGQIIEWDEDAQVFYNLSQKEYLNENQLRKIFAEVIQGLYYLHKNGIIHRDIKPQNILQTLDGTIKIADFGVADIVEGEDFIKKSEGTYHFMAPESVTTNQNPKGYSGKVADIWAMGVTFYAFAFYKVPFYGSDALELFENIENQELEFPEDVVVSDDLKNLLRSLLQKDPNNRPTLDEIMNHAWFHKDKLTMDLASTCASQQEEITVTNEEIMNAFTPIERVVFMKRICKKFIGRVRNNSKTEPEREIINKREETSDI